MEIKVTSKLFDTSMELVINNFVVEDPEDKGSPYFLRGNLDEKEKRPSFLLSLFQSDPANPEFKSVYHQILNNLKMELQRVDFFLKKETFPSFLEFILFTFVPDGPAMNPLPSLVNAKSRFGTTYSNQERERILLDTNLNLLLNGISVQLLADGADVAKLK